MESTTDSESVNLKESVNLTDSTFVNNTIRQPITIERKVVTRLPTSQGEFKAYLYRSSRDPSKDHLALVYGNIGGDSDTTNSVSHSNDVGHSNVLTRLHSECFTGEVLGSVRCDCREQLQTAQRLIAEAGAGVIVYLRQEGRGIGLLDKLRAYNLQDTGLDTIDANLALGHAIDSRDYQEAALILQDLGVESVRLLTNNPDKVQQLEKLGVKVVERVSMVPKLLSTDNLAYLTTKITRMNHLLDLTSKWSYCYCG